MTTVRIRFAQTVSLIGLVFASCGSPDAIGFPPAVSTSQHGAGPAATLTSTAETTPTENPFELEILEWHRWAEPLDEYDVERGWSYVYTLVRNPHEFAVEVVGTPTARLFNGAGEFVYRSRGADILDGSLMGIGQILPGETIGIYFCACGTAGSVAVPEWESFALDFDPRETEAVTLSTDFQVSPINVNQADYFSVIYTLTYSGQQPLRAVAVRLTVSDQEGSYLGSGEVGILGRRSADGYDPIQPGTTFDFSGMNEDPPAVSVLLDPAYKDAPLTYEIYAVGSLAE